MSYAATAWAWRQRQLDPGPKMILLALADYANPSGFCYPSQKRLEIMTGIKTRSIRRHLMILEEQGLIRREDRRTDSGQRTSDGYWLPIPEGELDTDQQAAKSAGSKRPNRPLAKSATKPIRVNSDEPVIIKEVDDATSPPPKKKLSKSQSKLAQLPEKERAIIQFWRDTVQRFPPETLWEYVIATLTHGRTKALIRERFQRTALAFLANHHGNPNVAAICEWYLRDQTTKFPAGNGNGRANGNGRSYAPPLPAEPHRPHLAAPAPPKDCPDCRGSGYTDKNFACEHKNWKGGSANAH